LLAQMPCQGSRIDSFDRDDLSFLQRFLKRLLAPPVADKTARFHDHESFCPCSTGFDIFWRDSIVTDMRTGHHDDLPLIGRISQYLLIAGHGRIKDDLSHCFSLITKSAAFKHRSIRQCQYCFLHSLPPWWSERFALMPMSTRPNRRLSIYNDRIGRSTRNNASKAAFLVVSSFVANACA